MNGKESLITQKGGENWKLHTMLLSSKPNDIANVPSSILSHIQASREFMCKITFFNYNIFPVSKKIIIKKSNNNNK